MPTHIFLSFAKADSDKIQSLKDHLATLTRNQEIILYSPNDYPAGTNIEMQIQEDLAKSDYFLACLSSKYNSNNDCQKEVKMATHKLDDNAIIPLLLQSCDWEYAPFVGKKTVPKSEKFIYSQKGEYLHEYYTEVVQSIKELITPIQNMLLQNTETYINFNATLLDKNDNNMLIGRRADFEKLKAALSPNKPTNIKGIAGIGKTTLVNFYLSQSETKKRFPTVHRIVLADSRQEQKMNRSIAENTDYQMNTLYEALFLYFLDKIEFGDANHETKLHKIAQYLAQNGKNTLLILDNADSYQDIDRNLAFLRKTNCTILITSRNHIQGTNEIVIEKVSLDAAKIMFAAYNATPYPPERIESLLQNIDCHTLLIELCAKQLYEGADVTIEELITAAAQYDFSVLTASHIALSDDTYIETALDKFILYLFRPDTLTENEQQILRYFSLLRNIEYPLDKLVQWFTDNNSNNSNENKHLNIFRKLWNKLMAIFSKKINKTDTINILEILFQLSQKGWIQKNIPSETNYNNLTYQCHLIVSYAIRKLLVPKIDNCISFLENIKKEGDYTKMKHNIYSAQYLPDILQIMIYIRGEKEIIADIYLSIGNLYHTLGDYFKALEYYNNALIIYNKLLSKKYFEISMTYNNIGAIHHLIGNYQEALIYYQKAIFISIKVLDKKHLDISMIYNNIGEVYHTIKDYPQALEYYQKAIIVNEQIFGKAHPKIFSTYTNIGTIYNSISNYTKALEYFKGLLITYEKVLGKEHSDVATLCNNIGAAYEGVNDYQKALEYYQKALAISEKLFKKEHPDTAIIYYNIGIVYSNMSNYSKALKYINKALIIIEKKLSKNHPYYIDWIQKRKNILKRINKK